ncbi:MAG TPA: M17 family peptidase N-terminal domain-containing protein, partial [Micromonosporaceae bacterium]
MQPNTELATLRLVDTDPAELTADAVVIGVYSQDADAPSPLLLASGAESIAVAFDGKLTDTLQLLGAAGSVGEVTKVATLGTITAPLVVAVGLGPEPTGALPPT